MLIYLHYLTKYILFKYTGNPLTCTLAYSEDPDDMPHKSTWHEVLYLLLRQNLSSWEENQYFFEIVI